MPPRLFLMVGYDSVIMSVDDPVKLPTTFGQYELTEMIGEGDIGRVYTARSLLAKGFDKRLVIKLIKPELSKDASFVEAFMAEARLAVSLSHTNIVQVVELGENEGLPFIVMEHVKGMNLALCNQLLSDRGESWDQLLAAFVTAEVAMGLDHAHRRRDLEGRPLGIVHQDVIPSNVLLSYEGAVKITDFGMAGVVGPERLTRATHPRYLAPEQVRGETVDPRTDVYGCGLLLYEMLSGQPPLADLSREEAIDRLGLGTVPVLGEPTKIRIEETLIDVLAKATASWPDDRYEDAATLYEALMSTIFGAGRQVGRRELVDFMGNRRKALEKTGSTPAKKIEKALQSFKFDDGTSDIDVTAVEGLEYQMFTGSLSPLPEGRNGRDALDSPPTVVPLPFRGREEERVQLAEIVAETAHKTTGVVELVGMEGIGKTRLVLEVVGRMKAREVPLDFFTVQCRELPKGGRYSAARAALRSVLGLGAPTKGEDLELAARRLREFGLSQYELEAVQDVIGVGPGNAPPGPRRARAAGLGFGQILRKIGEDRLTILFWDDADLMDTDSMRLLARAVKHSTQARLLILVTRGKGPSPWPVKLDSNVVQLDPLEAQPMKKMICDAMTAEEADEALTESVAAIAGGNPRFAGELVRLMEELGRASVTDGVAFLDGDSVLRKLTLAEVIDWRLEVRSELERAVLEVAACVGSMFEVWLICKTTGMALAYVRPVLEALIRSRILTGRPDEACAFTHQLIHKRVLATLSDEDLVTIHSRIAEAMASSEVANDATWRLRCSTHLREAGQREQARDLLATSAAQLEFAGATDAAIDHFSAALELTRGTEEAPVAMALALRTATLASRCGRIREGLRAAKLAIEIAKASRDAKEEIKALVLTGRLIGSAGKIEDASNRFREALKVAQSLNNQNAHQMIRGAMGELLVQTGDFRRALPHLEQAISVAPGPETPRFVLLASICRGRAGEEDPARELLERVEGFANETTDPTFRTGLLLAWATLDTTAGRHEKAIESLQESRELARSFGLHYDNALATHHLGCVLLAIGRPKRAFASLRYSYELSREYGFERLLRLNLVALAALDVLHHRRTEPLARIQAALSEARDGGFLSDILQIRFYLSQALIAVGQPEEAKTQLGQARKAGRATGNLMYDADIELLLGSLK